MPAQLPRYKLRFRRHVRRRADPSERSVYTADLLAAGYRFLGGRLAIPPHGPAALLVYADCVGRPRGSALPREAACP